MPKLTYYGHSTCSIETDDGVHLVIDPFFDDNPACDVSAGDVQADFILLSHGHYDHIADAVPIAKRTGATVICSYEIGEFMGTKDVQASPHHIGGGVRYPFGPVKLTPALHGGMVELPGGEPYTTVPAGLLVDFESGQTLYHAGDTSLLTDMQLLKGQVDVAMLPIGDRFTMGPADAVRAIDFIEPEVVVPIHYNTWPPIEQDADAFKATVGNRARVEIMKCGDTFDF
ncbi:MAG: metal-dependent hydrolase [Gemmatimonadota bacterium]|jgi:L-ascorbate metabolism protein UlaG (beta-lactamase superfamily)